MYHDLRAWTIVFRDFERSASYCWWPFISRNRDYNWPPRSYDLTPLDFFLWGYVKDKVYADTPQSIEELKEKIRAVIDEIEPQICENVMENFMKRMQT